MKYDDDRYLNNDEEDNDLWDDELELLTGDSRPASGTSPQHSNASDSHYTPYTPPYDDESADQSDESDMSDMSDQSDSSDQSDQSDQSDDNDYYSDPDPAPKAPSKSRGFFRKKKKPKEEEEEGDDDDDDEDNDYYDSYAEPAPKKPKAPKLDPEDPDYWISEEEESPLSGFIPNPGSKWKWQLGIVAVLLLMILGAWVWFLCPYADNAVKYGYIRDMERRGSLFKTFEGTMIPYKELGDPNPFYFQELKFSVASDSIAAQMKRMMLDCIPVRVEYETYHAPLPWLGEQKIIILKADTADPRKILPPEYRTP